MCFLRDLKFVHQLIIWVHQALVVALGVCVASWASLGKGSRMHTLSSCGTGLVARGM